MTKENFIIACEETVPVNATHTSLPRFGDNPRSTEFANYIKVLKTFVHRATTVQSAEVEEECRSAIEKEVRAEVHQFYDVAGRGDTDGVRLWSVNPSLYELFEKGPRSFLLTRSEEAKRMVGNSVSVDGKDVICPEPMLESTTSVLSAKGLSLAIPSEASTSVDSPISPQELKENTEVPEPLASTQSPVPGSSDDSRSGYHIPDASQYLFRWIHIPANHMAWVEKTLRTIDKEVALQQFDKAVNNPSTGTCVDSPVKSTSAPETPCSEPEYQATKLLENPTVIPALSHLFKGAVVEEQKQDELTAPDLLAKAVQDPAQTMELLRVSQLKDPRQPTSNVRPACNCCGYSRADKHGQDY
jgi:hypothetical protein